MMSPPDRPGLSFRYAKVVMTVAGSNDSTTTTTRSRSAAASRRRILAQTNTVAAALDKSSADPLAGACGKVGDRIWSADAGCVRGRVISGVGRGADWWGGAAGSGAAVLRGAPGAVAGQRAHPASTHDREEYAGISKGLFDAFRSPHPARLCRHP